MGPGGSGKTSMRAIIFANFVARSAMATITPTVSVERNQIRFLGNLVLNLWDCGGQNKFMESYFGPKEEHIFKNVSVMIFVIDVTSTNEQDLEDYKKSVELLRKHSEDAKIFCLVHKMDLIPKDQRESTFEHRKKLIEENSQGIEVTSFQTSIWHDTLYRAWSKIVYSLIPNADIIAEHLDHFCKSCEAEEVVLFEKETFLNISHSSREHSSFSEKNIHRFDSLSSIIKSFKLSCLKLRSTLKNLLLRTSQFDAFIYEFTQSTYIMIIIGDIDVKPATILMNLKNAQIHFEKLINL